MSLGLPINGEHARKVAESIRAQLAPHCHKIEIAGSLRRGKTLVHDIELVVVSHDEPAPAAQQSLFSDDAPEMVPVVHRVLHEWQDAGWIHSLQITQKICKFETAKAGIPVDLYLATPTTFGTLFLIRTGSREHNILLCQRAKSQGKILKADGTGLIDAKTGKPYGTHTEQQILKILGLAYVNPRDREVSGEVPL